jgi:hypothetical protein
MAAEKKRQEHQWQGRGSSPSPVPRIFPKSREAAPDAGVREESLEERLDRELLDVPAAVVCVLCGETDCPGCENEQSRSGIVAIIAWERPGMPMFSRLWSTARSTTRDAEGFFELMPDGPIVPALRFAALCELCAATSLLFVLFAIAVVVAPEWVKAVALDADARSLALRVVLLGVPAFASLLVVAHAAHGLSIDLGATRNGARGAKSRALRFGLYACGWDLVTSPVGGVVVALKEGLRAAMGLTSLLTGLPTRATKAFLRGCYRLDAERAKRALGTSYVGAAVVTIGFALIVLLGVAAVLVTSLTR